MHFLCWIRLPIADVDSWLDPLDFHRSSFSRCGFRLLIGFSMFDLTLSTVVLLDSAPDWCCVCVYIYIDVLFWLFVFFVGAFVRITIHAVY